MFAHIEAMTKKLHPVEATQDGEVQGWYFPTLNKSVSAETYEEALALVTQEKEEEEVNGNS